MEPQMSVYLQTTCRFISQFVLSIIYLYLCHVHVACIVKAVASYRLAKRNQLVEDAVVAEIPCTTYTRNFKK